MWLRDLSVLSVASRLHGAPSPMPAPVSGGDGGDIRGCGKKLWGADPLAAETTIRHATGYDGRRIQ